jgi:hypothetical protein
MSRFLLLVALVSTPGCFFTNPDDVASPRAARARASDRFEETPTRSGPDGADYRLLPDAPFRRGDAVVAVWSGSGQWYEAHVIEPVRGGARVEFDLDGVVEDVPSAKLRHRRGGSGPYAGPPPTAHASVDDLASAFRVGAPVTAQWDVTGTWYDAHVIDHGSDGSVLIRFDLDGIEQWVSSSHTIRHR